MEKPVLKKKKKTSANHWKTSLLATLNWARQSPEGHRQAVDHLGCSGTPTVEMVSPSGRRLRGGPEAVVGVLS